MIKNISKMEVKIADKTYQFLCDSDSPIGQVYDALSEMKGVVIDKMYEIEKKPEVEKDD